jgi:uncharacterized protein (TIGR00290 family)
LYSLSIDEQESHMYQTIGHNVVQAIADAMRVPLFRRQLAGSAVTTDLVYTRTLDDEVEDLYQLLLQVKTAIPDVTAVSSGAILSNYQRLRVENVCSRLGLTSLAYLWQKDQSTLLREMIDSGLEAIMVKVASMGWYTTSPCFAARTSLQTIHGWDRSGCSSFGSQFRCIIPGIDATGKDSSFKCMW